MSIIIIDVETSGLPIGRNALYTDLAKYDNARIVQMSFMICDNNFQELELNDFIVKADGFSINNSQFHGITDEISRDKGMSFVDVAKELAKYLPEAKYILAHNADFDINVIKSELYRYGLRDILANLDTKNVVCTMKKTMNILNIRNKYGIKFPSLAELYLYVFEEHLQNAHNSKYDVINLYKAIKVLYEDRLFVL